MQVELLEENPFASRNTATSAATLSTRGQVVCDAERDARRATGSLLRDPRHVRKGVLEGQVCSTYPQESPAKGQSMAMQRGAEAEQRIASPRARNNSV